MSSTNKSYISPLQSMYYSENDKIDREEFESESSAFFLYLQQYPTFKFEEPIIHCPDPTCMSRKRKQWTLSEFEQHVRSIMNGKFLKNARHNGIFKFIESQKNVHKEKFLSGTSFSTSLVYIWPSTAIVYYYEPDLSLNTSPTVQEYLNKQKFGPGKIREVWEKKKAGRTGFHLVDFTGDMIGLHNALLMNQFFKDDLCGRENFLWRFKEADGKMQGKMYGWIATVADTTDLPKRVTDKLMHTKICLTIDEAQKMNSKKRVRDSTGSSSGNSDDT